MRQHLQRPGHLRTEQGTSVMDAPGAIYATNLKTTGMTYMLAWLREAPPNSH